MISTVDIDDFLSLAAQLPVIDVRSPSEYARGHLARAKNVPLFDDEERAEIGTLYHHAGRQAATLRAFDLVGPRMRDLTERMRAHQCSASEPRILLHCWRGGMRSHSMAWLLHQMELQPILLQGGYQAFRRLAHRGFQSPWNLVVLSGLTGSGKTQQLALLRAAGEQVVDLEALAHHRGSAFGGLGLASQPTVEQFSNRLFDQLRGFDPSRRIWVEDEGKKIGRVVIPDDFFRQLRRAPAIFMNVPKANRVRRLVNEYGHLLFEQIESAVQKIKKRLGGHRVLVAQEALQRSDLLACADILLEYYDRAYLLNKSRMSRKTTYEWFTELPTAASTTAHLCSLADQILSPVPAG